MQTMAQTVAGVGAPGGGHPNPTSLVVVMVVGLFKYFFADCGSALETCLLLPAYFLLKCVFNKSMR